MQKGATNFETTTADGIKFIFFLIILQWKNFQPFTELVAHGAAPSEKVPGFVPNPSQLYQDNNVNALSALL